VACPQFQHLVASINPDSWLCQHRNRETENHLTPWKHEIEEPMWRINNLITPKRRATLKDEVTPSERMTSAN
jgi:hypothetical protein